MSKSGGLGKPKNRFTPADDAVIIAHVRRHGNKDWDLLAVAGGKNGKKCYERYHNHLDENVDKSA